MKCLVINNTKEPGKSCPDVPTIQALFFSLSLILAVTDGFLASLLAPAVYMKERRATVKIVGTSWT